MSTYKVCFTSGDYGKYFTASNILMVSYTVDAPSALSLVLLGLLGLFFLEDAQKKTPFTVLLRRLGYSVTTLFL